VLEAERVRLALLQEKIKEVLTMLRTLNAMVRTLIKKKIKFSSYIRKSRREQLQRTASSCMTKYLRISSYIRKPFLTYDLATDLRHGTQHTDKKDK
jgi:hypothetical protein